MTTPRVAIIGAGFAGVGMAIGLLQAGIRDFTIYERSDRIGGTWRENDYPGAGCDIPSFLYSFSFEYKVRWERVYAEQREILRYLEYCVEKYGLSRYIRFNANIVHAKFDTGRDYWVLRSEDGTEQIADVVVSAVGQLATPKMPDIEGSSDFVGTVFHSARWRHDHDLKGRRVAIVGCGASAIQLTPHVAKLAEHLVVLQRTPSWIIPALPSNRRYRAWEQWAAVNVPLYAGLMRLLTYLLYEGRVLSFFRGSWMSRWIAWLARQHLERAVTDERLRQTLTPDYPPGCKRILLSTDYYPALTRPNVSVTASRITRIVERGVVTDDGIVHEVDTIIFATGFQGSRFLAQTEFEGVGGRRLSEEWRAGAEAYLGIGVAGFPNLFLLYGPNTGLGHNSVVFMIERQIAYILRCIRLLASGRTCSLQVRADAQFRFNRDLHERLASTQWSAGCTSWYMTEGGKIVNNWPGTTLRYWWLTRRVDLGAFVSTAQPVATRDTATGGWRSRLRMRLQRARRRAQS